MANIKFTEFPSAATVGAMDIIPIVQDGANKKATAAVFQTYIGSLFVGLTGTQTITGSKTFSSPIISSVVTGSAPFTVASTTKVTNLNADLLDGLSSAAFQTVLTNPVTGTGTTNYLPKFTGASALGDSLVYDNGTSVGIGTATPFGGAKLQIKTSTDINIAFQNGTLDATGVKINAYNDAASLNIPLEVNGSVLYFKTGETERMRIASSGNLLLNTSTDSGYKLDVNGTAIVRGGLLSIAAGDIYIQEGGRGILSPDANRLLVIQNGLLGVNGAATFSSSVTALGNAYFGTFNNSNKYYFEPFTNLAGGANNAYLVSSKDDNNERSGFVFQAKNSNGVEYNAVIFEGHNSTSTSTPLTIEATGAATFSGSVAIGNPVAAAVAVASTHKVTIVIGGVTYYLLATNV